MIVTVRRFTSDDDSTLSEVMIDGDFACFGLEDEYRAHKVPRETRIPAGRYQVRLRREGGFDGRYQQRFGRLHHGMLHVTDVPGFRWILIHVGNTDDDTAGCLLVGVGANAEPGNMSVSSSVRAYLRLYALVRDAAARGELWIEYVDDDARRLPLGA